MLVFLSFFLPLTFLGLGILLLFIAKKYKQSIDNKKKDCTVKTKARIIDMIETRLGNKAGSDTIITYTYYPVYEFYANGEYKTQKSCIGLNNKSLFIGQEVDLYYNPYNSSIYVPAEGIEKIFIYLKIIGFIFIGISILSVFFIYLIYKIMKGNMDILY